MILNAERIHKEKQERVIRELKIMIDNFKTFNRPFRLKQNTRYDSPGRLRLTGSPKCKKIAGKLRNPILYNNRFLRLIERMHFLLTMDHERCQRSIYYCENTQCKTQQALNVLVNDVVSCVLRTRLAYIYP